MEHLRPGSSRDPRNSGKDASLTPKCWLLVMQTASSYFIGHAECRCQTSVADCLRDGWFAVVSCWDTVSLKRMGKIKVGDSRRSIGVSTNSKMACVDTLSFKTCCEGHHDHLISIECFRIMVLFQYQPRLRHPCRLLNQKWFVKYEEFMDFRKWWILCPIKNMNYDAAWCRIFLHGLHIDEVSWLSLPNPMSTFSSPADKDSWLILTMSKRSDHHPWTLWAESRVMGVWLDCIQRKYMCRVYCVYIYINTYVHTWYMICDI